MLSRRRLLAVASVLSMPAAARAAMAPGVAALVPAGYPRSYASLIEAAARERKLVLYTTMNMVEVGDLFVDFNTLYPFVEIAHVLESSTTAQARLTEETAARRRTADVVWLSTMDTQVKLINDGYAQPYNSPEKPNLPDWAVWKNEGWSITAEPVVLVYNSKLVSEGEVPRSREALRNLLRSGRERYLGRIGTYNLDRSSLGFLLFSEDARIYRDTWALVHAIAETDPKLYIASDDMVNAVIAGDIAIAYNVLGTSAFEGRKRAPELGVVFPSEYTQMASNIAFIAKDAESPAAAKLFLDYLLSARGQEQLLRRSYTPVNFKAKRNDALRPVESRSHAVRMGPGLLANLDRIKRMTFMTRWNAILRGGKFIAYERPDRAASARP